MQVSGNNNPLLYYKLAYELKESQTKAFEAQPTVVRDLVTFSEDITSIRSVDDLMKNRVVLNMVLSAFQLESEIDKPAMVEKILTESPTNEESLVNRLAEPRWTKLAEALHPLNSDPDFFQKQDNVDAILTGYKTNEYEKYQGENADGVREAMYFKRLAGDVETVTQIIADKALMRVVRVGLGLPESFQGLSFDQQLERLERMVDVEDFKDPEKIDEMIDRFLIFTQVNNNDPTANPMLSLFQPIGNGEFVGPAPLQIDFSV
ncbi:DUF1217 domain-containing protein [Sneathiella marina]|uniref:DUF1217 domain-containing protein n=1 Tax=Sneathiella marina TaxID=2950108 RepID=A0ABY4W822_9PROT|nr:DUF1217 domain-containing protein [Sneathiella marina]USG62072.1 DUF1217 domain-containing protein [Sneathiella marina]